MGSESKIGSAFIEVVTKGLAKVQTDLNAIKKSLDKSTASNKDLNKETAKSGGLAKTAEGSFKSLSNTINSIGSVAQKSFLGGTAAVLGFIKAADPYAFSIFSGNLAMLAVQIGSIFLPLIDKANTYLEKLLGWFRNLSDEQKDNILRWVEIAGAIALGLALLPKIIMLINLASAAMALFGVETSIATGGITTILGLLAALAGGFILFGGAAGQGSEILKSFTDAFKPLVEAIEEVGKMVLGTLSDAFKQIQPIIVENIKMAVELFKGIIENFKPVLDAFGKLFGVVFGIIGGIIKAVMPFIKAQMELLGAIFGAVFPIIGGIVRVFGVVLKALSIPFLILMRVVMLFYSVIYRVFAKIIQAVTPIIKAIMEIVEEFAKLFEEIFAEIEPIIEEVFKALEELADAFLDAFGDVIIEAVKACLEVIKWVFEAIKQVIGAMKEAYGVVKDIVKAVPDTISSVADTVGDVISAPFEAIGSLWDAAFGDDKPASGGGGRDYNSDPVIGSKDKRLNPTGAGVYDGGSSSGSGGDYGGDDDKKKTGRHAPMAAPNVMLGGLVDAWKKAQEAVRAQTPEEKARDEQLRLASKTASGIDELVEINRRLLGKSGSTIGP